jgi:hypothetical protein
VRGNLPQGHQEGKAMYWRYWIIFAVTAALFWGMQ